MNTLTLWVVKDSDGILRPLAGVWIDKLEERTGINYGEESAKEYQVKNKNGDIVIKCLLTEIR